MTIGRHRRQAPALLGLLLLAAISFAPDLRANSPPRIAPLTTEEAQTLDQARAAIMELPEIKAATARFNMARKTYQEDRKKFPADRDKKVQEEFRKATSELEAAKEKALLVSNPALKPLLDKEAAAKKKSSRGMNEGETLADSDHPGNPAIRPIQDIAGLPRVLLIGDSVSIGYTLQVRKLLEGRANVHRIPVNGGATEVGLANMKKWLGNGKWDVIHFNFGIHDRGTSAADYVKRLEAIVARLEKTGAKLIWASTTPIPDNPAQKQTAQSIVEKNALAAEVMKKHGIPTDDLFAAMTPRLKEFQPPLDVHFTGAGYDFLGAKVGESVLERIK
jgi:acyl-CoA thioesterase-1